MKRVFEVEEFHGMWMIQGTNFVLSEKELDNIREPVDFINCKFKFKNVVSTRFKVGKIYDVEDGRVTDEYGIEFPIVPFTTEAELAAFFSKVGARRVGRFNTFDNEVEVIK